MEELVIRGPLVGEQMFEQGQVSREVYLHISQADDSSVAVSPTL